MNPNARSPSITSQESYSAVIIADLVAEIPIEPEFAQRPAKSLKQEINLGYDGRMVGETSPSVVKLESEVGNNMKMNGAGSISKGVILNAMQFGKADLNAKIGEKPIQLTNNLPAAQPIPEPSGFKDMSLLRKIAFGFSFIPSILFVLCFAIILPCKVPSPCVVEMWLKTINDAEPSSRLVLTPNVAFTLMEKGESYFMTLGADTGSELKNVTIPAGVKYFDCGKVINAEEDICIVMDKTGEINAFNSSSGGLSWHPAPESNAKSLPVILPDCDGDGIEEIAVAVSNTQIQILRKANIVSSAEIPFCDTVPTTMIPWTSNGSTDIVFTCKKGGKDAVVKMPQSIWCPFNKKAPLGNLLKLNTEMDFSRGKLLYPTETGLVLWAGDDVSMFLPDGERLWKISNDTHSNKNRFILYGNFLGKGQQIALLSSDISSTLEISILNSSDGSIIKSNSFLNSEATEVLQLQGIKRDFALVVLRKMRKSVIAEALEQIDGISTTIVSYISNEEFNDTHIEFSNDISEEIALLDLDRSFHSIKEMDFGNKRGATSKVTMTAAKDKEKNLLIYLLSFPTHSVSKKVTKIRNIKVLNWDISASKSSECTLN